MKPEAISGPAIRLVIKPLPGPSGYAFNLPEDDATHAFLSGILRADSRVPPDTSLQLCVQPGRYQRVKLGFNHKTQLTAANSSHQRATG